MTNPTDPMVRLANLEAAFEAAGQQIAAIGQALAAGSARLDTMEAVYSSAGERLTAAEGNLAQAIATFQPVGVRVAELSSAALAFNDRLNLAEQRLMEWFAQNPISDDQLDELSQRVTTMDTRLARVEQVRARGGRLSDRLASIEAKLDRIVEHGEEPPE